MNNMVALIIAIVVGLAAGGAAGVGLCMLVSRLRTRKMPTEKYQTSFVFSGNLKQTSLVDAIQFLEIGKREGILHIYCGRRKGYITFSKGMVIDAFYRNATGREAMFLMLDIEEGDFYFEPKVVNQPRLISDSIMDIVMSWDEQRSSKEPEPQQ
jgi:hypothetical protein